MRMRRSRGTSTKGRREGQGSNLLLKYLWSRKTQVLQWSRLRPVEEGEEVQKGKGSGDGIRIHGMHSNMQIVERSGL